MLQIIAAALIVVCIVTLVVRVRIFSTETLLSQALVAMSLLAAIVAFATIDSVALILSIIAYGIYLYRLVVHFVSGDFRSHARRV